MILHSAPVHGGTLDYGHLNSKGPFKCYITHVWGWGVSDFSGGKRYAGVWFNVTGISVTRGLVGVNTGKKRYVTLE